MIPEARTDFAAWLHKPSPVVDATYAAIGPDEYYTDGTGIVLSPGARNNSVVSAKLDVWIEKPTTLPGVKAETHGGCDYLHSNLPGRGRQPINENGYDLTELYLGKDPDNRAAREMQLEYETAQYVLGLKAATTGPVGLKTVVLHDEAASYYVPTLEVIDGRVARGSVDEDGVRRPLTREQREVVAMTPGGEFVGEPTLADSPVPPGWSTRRVARMLANGSRLTCQFSDVFDDCVSQWGTCWVVLAVTCGARTHLAATCAGCQFQLEKLSRDHDLDFIIADGWDHDTGYPQDSDR